MHNQRVELRTGFGFENGGNSVVATGICAEAIDRLRREGDQLPLRQQRRRARNTRGVCRQNFGR